LVEPKLREIGLTTRKDDSENTIRLREILLGLDYYAEDEANLKKLAEMYDEDYSKMDPETRSAIMDAKVYVEPEIMDKFVADYKTTADPEIKYELLFALALSHDTERLRKLMKLLNDLETVKPQDQFYLFIYLYRNPRGKKDVFEWLTKNWEFVREMAGDKTLENYPRYVATSVRTKEEFDEYRKFFEPKKNDPAVARAVEIGMNEIRSQLALIEKDKKTVCEKLDSLM
jgi:aminopeptidase N